MMLLFLCVFTALLMVSSNQKYYNDYPKFVPVFELRLDHYSGKPVETGLAHKLNSKTSILEFKKHMQCLDIEPNFDFNGGSISLMQSIPPTRETVEVIAALRESYCNPWRDCQKLVKEFKAATTHNKMEDSFASFFMFRVLKGELYYDWPWGIERFAEKFEPSRSLDLFAVVLDAISDVKDSVFMIGGEHPGLFYNVPFPIFSYAPRMGFIDMVLPWFESIVAAQTTYQEILANKLPFTDGSTNKVHRHRPWDRKIPKAAFFGTYDVIRQDIMDACRLHPDMFDLGFNIYGCIEPHNPTSTEDCQTYETGKQFKGNITNLPGGYATALVNGKFYEREYHRTHYKYIIVPMGMDGDSSTGRLAGLLAHSGAVILLVRSPFVYHFSTFLIPWVHYVPLSYGGADVVEKVRWLREHDDLARQIAANGRTFARSYLRLEDYYCYAANALQMLGDLQEGSNVTMPFNPVKITKRDPQIEPILKSLTSSNVTARL